MAAITVDIVSRETVKPSTPTPPQLRSYKLSWIDQNHPIYHLPVVFFYSATPSAAADVGILKSSLSTGVDFFEARAADADLSEILSSDESDLNELKKFLPCSKGEASCCDSEPTVILSVQATVFRCGGIAVGACVSHKIADGRSLFLFLQAWAAAVRGSFSSENAPSFDSAAVFPPNENAVPYEAEQPPQVQKRFVLDGPKIAALREKMASSATRFQAVMALVWRCAVRARPHARGGAGGGGGGHTVAVGAAVSERLLRQPLRSSCRRHSVRRVDGGGVRYEHLQQLAAAAGVRGGLRVGPAAWACTTQERPSAMAVLPRPPAAGDPQGMEIWASLEKDEMAELKRELDKLVPLNPVHHVTQS
uniref:Salutaridinol 7-O-acetyltransferase-like n=1 Tax=Ananas comosus var. bracteatus TaxID=296719 RepID=A0A6V7Q1M3_ANACO|nr:unnamed protein product [Ananas comosus var. bracteatus]